MTETANKFTPGPWHLEWPSESSDALDPTIVDAHEHPVAFVNESGEAPHDEEAESTHNARLIAKAPEMYVLLERLADKARDGNRVLDIAVTTWRDWCQEARRIKAEIDQGKEKE